MCNASRVVQDSFGRSTDLIGYGVVLVPVPQLLSSGTAPVIVRVPLTFTGGSLSIKLTIPTGQPTADGVVSAVDASRRGNNNGTFVPH